jgi:hypothetical protein
MESSVAGKSKKMTAVVHELMDGTALDEQRRSLFGADKINCQQKQDPAKNCPWQNFTEWNRGDGDRLWSECTGYGLSHSRTSGIMRPKAEFRFEK